MRWINLFQKLDCVAVLQAGCDRSEVAGLFVDLIVERPDEQRFAGHVDSQGGEFPVATADVGLFEDSLSALIQLAKNSESEIDVRDEVGFQTGETLLGLIDPHLAGDAAKDSRLKVGLHEVGIRNEAEPVALAGGAGDDVFEVVKKRVWQEAE